MKYAVNSYTVRFNVRCPNQEHGFIGYVLTIESDKMIMVEDIKKHTKFSEAGYHENIADYLYAELGGKQTITATHHGVEITTLREDDSRFREAIKQGILRKGIGNLDLVCDYVIEAMK